MSASSVLDHRSSRKRPRSDTEPNGRPTQACDQCNYRKIKCRVDDGDRSSCISCHKTSLTCTWERDKKPRGPKWKTSHPAIVLNRSEEASQEDDRSETQGAEVIQIDKSNPPSLETIWPWSTQPPETEAIPVIPTDPYPINDNDWRSSSQMDDTNTDPNHISQTVSDTVVSPNEWDQLLSEMGYDGPSFFPAPPLFIPDPDWPISDHSVIMDLGLPLVGGIEPSMMPQGSSTSASMSPIVASAESVVHNAIDAYTDPLVLQAALPLPEPDSVLRRRVEAFFPGLCAYIPVLTRHEMINALNKDEHHRSLHFRALTLSTVALGATVSTVVGLRRGSTASFDDSSSREGSVTDGSSTVHHRRTVRTYLEGAKRCLSLCDSQSTPDNTISSIVTCIHLFMTYEWLKDHVSSWDYLQMAITRAQRLGIDRWEQYESEKSQERRMWLATRLRLYYLLCLLERSHALLRPPELSYAQSLRLPGRPWASTAAFRETLPPSALFGLQTGHIRFLDLVDDNIIQCSRGRCGGKDNLRHCGRWSTGALVEIQEELSVQLDDILSGRTQAINGRPTGTTETGDFEIVVRANLIVSIGWLQNLIFRVTMSHGHLSAMSVHDCLRPFFIIEVLGKLCSFRPVFDGSKIDVSLDCYYKLAELILTAEELLSIERPESVFNPMKRDESARLNSQLIPLALKCLGSMINSLGNHVLVQRVIKCLSKLF